MKQVIQPTSLIISGKLLKKSLIRKRGAENTLGEIMNAILYVNKTGCRWRMLPQDFSAWQTVYYYFRKWKLEGGHIVVDTLGLPMAVAVHEANLHDSKGKPKAIEKLEHKFPRFKKILADGGYQGVLGNWVTGRFGWVMEVVLRPDECPSKFQVLPKRWIVERWFSWLENFRRLTIDYEFLAETAESMVQLSFVQIMFNKCYNNIKTTS